jgi:hypothetical protein
LRWYFSQACDAFEAQLNGPIDKQHCTKWFDLSIAEICYARAGLEPPSAEDTMLAGYKSLQLPTTNQYQHISQLRQNLGTSSTNKRDRDRWMRVRDTIEASTHRVNWLALRKGRNHMENIWEKAW